MALTPEEQAELEALEAEFTPSKANTPPEVEKRVLDKDILTTLVETAGNLNPMSAAAGLVKKAPGVKEFVEQPNENYSPDMSNVAIAGGTGAALGAGIGAVTGGPMGAAAGTVGGGALGLIGGAAEELVKSMGGTNFQALLAGMGTGGLASLGKSAVAGIGKTLAASDTAYLSRSLRAALGISRSVDKEGMDVAEKAVRKNVLAEKPKVDFTATPNQNKVQEELAKKFSERGVTIPEGKLASDVLRDGLYGTMAAKQDVQPFIKTQAYKNLLDDLEVEEAFSKKGIIPSDLAEIKRFIRNQAHSNPRIREGANKALYELAQDGGTFVPTAKAGDMATETVINEKSRRLLAKHMDSYFEEVAGAPLYSELKAVEKAQIVARTSDKLPKLFLTKPSEKDLEEISRNISKYPEARGLFKQNLVEYFGSLPSGTSAQATGKIMMDEFKRLAGVLEETGLVTPKELNVLQDTFEGIPKNISAERWKQAFNKALNASMVAGASTLPKDVMRGE